MSIQQFTMELRESLSESMSNQELLKSVFCCSVRQRREIARAYYIERSYFDEYSLMKQMTIKLMITVTMLTFLMAQIWLLFERNIKEQSHLLGENRSCFLRNNLQDTQISGYLDSYSS